MIYHALVLREEYYLRGMPKQALQVYLNNITDFVGPNGPQLISLDAPFSASTVVNKTNSFNDILQLVLIFTSLLLNARKTH